MERRWMLSLLMVMGIVGYFTVPNVANYIVHAGGGNAILQKVNSLVSSGTSTVMAGTKAGAGMLVDKFGDARRNISQSMAEAGGNDYFKDKLSGNTKS